MRPSSKPKLWMLFVLDIGECPEWSWPVASEGPRHHRGFRLGTHEETNLGHDWKCQNVCSPQIEAIHFIQRDERKVYFFTLVPILPCTGHQRSALAVATVFRSGVILIIRSRSKKSSKRIVECWIRGDSRLWVSNLWWKVTDTILQREPAAGCSAR